MKKWIDTIVLCALALLIVWLIFKPGVEVTDLKPYQNKIDSLQKSIDSIYEENVHLESQIQVLEGDNQYLVNKIGVLNDKINDLKGDLKDAKSALNYTPTQVDSFFVQKYSKEYRAVSKDTTRLPLEVSKAAIVDIKEGEVNEKIVLVQDSIIKTTNESLTNRENVIQILRAKELNYFKVDSGRVEQINNYKIQVEALKSDLNKANRKLKFGKFEKIALGVAAIGLLIFK